MTDDTDNIVKPKFGKDGSTRRPGPGRGHKTKIGNGSHGEGGPGWGGPAKGVGNQGPGPGRMKDGPEREQKLLQDAERIENLKNKLYDIAMSDETPVALQINASVAALNRLEGGIVTRSINANMGDVGDLSDDELRAEFDRTTKAISSAGT